MPSNQYITLRQAQQLLSSRVPMFATVLKLGMLELLASPPIQLIDMTTTNKAANLNSFLYGNSRRRFAEDPGVEFKDLNQQRYLVMDAKVWLRFKLLKSDHLSRNLPTRQSLLWNAQLPLAGSTIQRLDRLELGYMPDALWTGIDKAYILLRVQNKVVWLWQIWGPRDDVFSYSQTATGADMFGEVRFAHHDYSI